MFKNSTHCRQDWLFLKITTEWKQNTHQVAYTEEQFFEQSSRDATCPQRPILSAFLHLQRLWLFLPTLECTGMNVPYLPIHKNPGREPPPLLCSHLPVSALSLAPLLLCFYLPPPVLSSGCNVGGTPGILFCLLPQPFVVPWPISYARCILLNLIHSVFMLKFIHNLVPLLFSYLDAFVFCLFLKSTLLFLNFYKSIPRFLATQLKKKKKKDWERPT